MAVQRGHVELGPPRARSRAQSSSEQGECENRLACVIFPWNPRQGVEPDGALPAKPRGRVCCAHGGIGIIDVGARDEVCAQR